MEYSRQTSPYVSALLRPIQPYVLRVGSHYHDEIRQQASQTALKYGRRLEFVKLE